MTKKKLYEIKREIPCKQALAVAFCLTLMFLTPVFAINENTTYYNCTDNSTLYLHSVTIIEGEVNLTETYTNCDYGCSANSCNPATYIGSAITIGIIIMIIIGMAAIYKFMRH